MPTELIELLSSKFGVPCERINQDTELIADLGADSLTLPELVTLLEKQTGKKVPGDEVLEVETVGELAALLDTLK